MMIDPSLEERLLEALRLIRTDIAEENRKREVRISTNEKRMRANRHATVAALLVAVVGVAVGYHDHQSFLSYKSDVAAARVFTCRKARSDAISLIHSEIRQSHDLIAALNRAAGRDSETDPAAVAYNAKHDALIRGSHTVRVCTPDGIARYLGQKGTR